MVYFDRIFAAPKQQQDPPKTSDKIAAFQKQRAALTDQIRAEAKRIAPQWEGDLTSLSPEQIPDFILKNAANPDPSSWGFQRPSLMQFPELHKLATAYNKLSAQPEAAELNKMLQGVDESRVAGKLAKLKEDIEYAPTDESRKQLEQEKAGIEGGIASKGVYRFRGGGIADAYKDAGGKDVVDAVRKGQEAIGEEDLERETADFSSAVDGILSRFGAEAQVKFYKDIAALADEEVAQAETAMKGAQVQAQSSRQRVQQIFEELKNADGMNSVGSVLMFVLISLLTTPERAASFFLRLNKQGRLRAELDLLKEEVKARDQEERQTLQNYYAARRAAASQKITAQRDIHQDSMRQMETYQRMKEKREQLEEKFNEKVPPEVVLVEKDFRNLLASAGEAGKAFDEEAAAKYREQADISRGRWRKAVERWIADLSERRKIYVD